MTKPEALERVAQAANAFRGHFSVCSLSPAQLVRWVGEYHELIGRLELALHDLRDAEREEMRPPLPASPRPRRRKK